MSKLIGTSPNQVPSNADLGSSAFMDAKDFLTSRGSSLSAIDAVIPETAVDVFIYDTSKDSDGGDWRKRTQHTSWYNEKLNTTTRGSRREFPAVAVIVAEAAKVTIYDGANPALPMWMVFSANSIIYSGSNSSIHMLNGLLCVTNSFATGVQLINFVSDKVKGYRSSSATTFQGNWTLGIAGRNQGSGNWDQVAFNPTIINGAVNDVDMTVLPNARIDPATGLPTPTIAVATAGGVSVITDSGAVYDSLSTFPYTSVDFSDEYLFFAVGNDNRGNLNGVYISEITADGWGGSNGYNSTIGYTGAGANSSIPSWSTATNSGLTNRTAGTANYRAFNGAGSLKQIITDGQNPTKALLNQTTSTYNTGWMNGAIKGAFLSDTDDTDLVGSGELVTNGTFDTDTTGWTVNNSTLGVSSGELTVTSSGSGAAYANQSFSTEIGKTYTFSVTYRMSSPTGSTPFADYLLGTSAYSANVKDGTNNSTGTNTTETHTFVAATATTYLSLRLAATAASQVAVFDNISVKLADADRSVNNKGLIVNGTVTRTPVAGGADLVAYSGFSASNYLEQPNSIIPTGLNDLFVMGWMKISSGGATIVSYEHPTAGNGFSLLSTYGGNGKLSLFTGRGGSNHFAYFDTAPSGVWNHFAVWRERQIWYSAVNGVVSGVTYNPGTDDFAVGGNLKVGIQSLIAGDSFGGSLALLRISATAPTAEQIAKIYNDEKVLFQENAKATLYGSSNAVTALAYDDGTDLLHVGTSAGRSVFQGLRRVDNTTDAVGTAISAVNGMVVEE